MRTLALTPWLLSVTLWLLILALSLPLGGMPYAWRDWQPASCLPDSCFCEVTADSLIVQPINTYSNLAYVLVGLWILEDALRNPSRTAGTNLMTRERALPLFFGLAAIAIGLGSFFYHASLTFAGQWFDLMGMYLYITLAALYNLARIGRLDEKGFAWGYLATNGALGTLLVVVPQVRREVFASLVVLTVVLEWALHRQKTRIQTGYFWAALGSLALGFLFWNLDNASFFCAPHSLVQGHAVWHILTAASVAFLYLYYRSEERELDGTWGAMRGSTRPSRPA